MCSLPLVNWSHSMVLRSLGILALLTNFLSPVHAGFITYTWQEDDAQPASGSFVVQEIAQTNGQITVPDIVSFGFQSPFSFFQLIGLNPSTFPVPISTSNAGFTGFSSVILSNTTVGTHLALPIDDKYNVVGGEKWTVTGPDGP